MNVSITSYPSKSKVLKQSVNLWFIVVVIGQLLFALYILGLYGVQGLAGNFERWNAQTTHGYVPKDLMGNIIFGIHVAMAAVITLGGPLQLIRKVRNKFPRFHRINGRIYIFSAFLVSIAGLYLSWVRGSVGGIVGSVFITINAVFILVCAFYTVRLAIARKLDAHRKWAIRLFLAMSGVWFFRVFLMLWLTIFQGPVGFDMDSFQGPALNMISTFSYILPVLFAEFYFRAKESKNNTGRWALSVFMWFLTASIAVGTFSATMGMWLPSI